MGGPVSLNSAVEVFNSRFYELVIHNAQLEKIWSGARWAEGPVYVPSARQLLFSDIPNDRTMRYDERTGRVDTYEHPAFNANGHCLDLEGRVITAEHRGRAVTRVGHDGQREILADQFEGSRLNSPNDVVARSDGSVWFTDPTYGIDSDYEGIKTNLLGAWNVITSSIRAFAAPLSNNQQLYSLFPTGAPHARAPLHV